jgi:peptidyl-prolyl cis-trans isomerase B (cyclophilin B)
MLRRPPILPVLFVMLAVAALPRLVSGQAPAKAPTAVITLEKGGEIALEFFPEDAPKHVENFVKLASQGFYDGTTFHRVEPGFVVQGGDPLSKTLKQGDPKLGTGDPGYKIKAEFNKRPFTRGILGMARSADPDSAGSQFYIMLGDASHLNGKYTAFGRVTSGMNVVDGIKPGDRIKSVKIVTK